MMNEKQAAVDQILRDFHKTIDNCAVLAPMVRWSAMMSAVATADARIRSLATAGIIGKPKAVTVNIKGLDEPLLDPERVVDLLNDITGNGELEFEALETHDYSDKMEIKSRLEAKAALKKILEPLDEDWVDADVRYKLRAWITGIKNKKCAAGNDTEKIERDDGQGPSYAGGGR